MKAVHRLLLLKNAGSLASPWIFGKLAEMNLRQHPAYCCDRNSFDGNPNVVAVLKGTGGGKSIILNGHIDVVPVGDEKNWTHDPFSGHIECGKLYGRGATDMKGGTVALLWRLNH